MIGWIVTSSVLIAVVLTLRTALKGRIRLRLQYALWLLVLVRLLVPVNPLSSPLSVMNAVPPAAVSHVTTASISPTPPDAVSPSEPKSHTTVQASLPAASVPQSSAQSQSHPAPGFTVKTALLTVWLAGVLAVAAALLISNFLFARRLRRVRRLFQTEGAKLPVVYLAEGLPSPCLFGLVHPAIYLTQEAVATETRLGQILTHEETHFRHGDHWWSLLRGVALALHWYNPLVWLAAIVSRRDAELCCDEDTIRRLGEEQRIDYGRTLLSMVSQRRDPAGLLSCATTMTSGKRGLRERITLLAKRPKTAATAAVCLLLAVCMAAGCTFTGPKPSSDSAAGTDEPVTPDLPVGYKLTGTVPLEDVQAYTPENQTVTPAEVSASDITEILPDGTGKDGILTLSDGTEVLCYRDKSGDKYWALKRGDTLTRFTREDNCYTDCYSADPFQDVFGHDGFRIVCPRGAAYTAYDYYYLDEDGSPQLLAECANYVTEGDLNGDGTKELLWYYHGNESYYYFEREGKLYLADVNGLIRDVLPDWTVSGVKEFDQEDAILPIFYQSIQNGPESPAYLRFTPEAIQVLEKEKSTEEMTVYICKGVKIGLPAKYADQLIVQTEFDSSEYSETYGLPLIRVSEKGSVEAGKADGISEGVGWLFTIRRLTRAQYEQYICGDRSEEFAFAVSGTDGDGQYGNVGQYTAPVYDEYYVFSTATDVQFYSSDGKIDTQSDAWKNWEELCDMGDAVRADMISRNGLTAYSDDQFLNQDFTYNSAHAYIKYYPYYTFDSDKSLYDTLVLSQPTQSIRPGEDSVWCVERWYDEFGNCYPYFPSFDVIEQENITAVEYYNRLQQCCEAGSGIDAEMRQLTPLGAAESFVTESGWYNDPNPAAGSFAETDGVDTAYTAQNVLAQQLVLDLMARRTVDNETLLSCAGGFTADTWGVLGRNEYGSDWWTPLKAALLKAAAGEQQDFRDQRLLHLYLSYSKSEGTIADGLKDVLSALYQADPLTFDKTLDICTTSEQARIRTALG
ncbi:peptidase M56 family protein [Oscillibacter valericigenes Sjm18-20]|nr:peptidase M56 family protein [Oscillibacter valericigenes Sjm18-20]